MQSNNPIFSRSPEFNGQGSTGSGQNAYGNQTYAGSGQPYAGYGQSRRATPAPGAPARRPRPSAPLVP